MQINLETDYAVRIVDCLACAKTRLDARTIATRTGVTAGFALKILRKLAGAGIVRSFRGAKGGYVLAREPGEITLKQVMEAIDGPIVLAKCQSDSYACDRPDGHPCSFHEIFLELSREISQRLEKITFDCCYRYNK